MGKDQIPNSGQIEKLREWRNRPDRAVSIETEVARLQKQVERVSRRLGEFITAWMELVPPDLASQTRISGMRGGIVHVVVESSPVMYELDRLLRDGMEAELRRRIKGTLTRVKMSIGGLNTSRR